MILNDTKPPVEADGRTFSVGIVGAGQFANRLAELFRRHPLTGRLFVTDVVPERAKGLAERVGATTLESFAAMLADDRVDAVAIFTQRWTHGGLAAEALSAHKHVYSAVPMAVSLPETTEIVDRARNSELIYMLGETSFYNPAVMYARRRYEQGDFGTVAYSEGDYLHDMDLGFADAYRYSGGRDWRRTASFPPMLYVSHSVGGVLGVLPTRAVAVSCFGWADPVPDGIFEKKTSIFDNDFSNSTALFLLEDSSVMRINEMRRVGYPAKTRESRFRFFGTQASFEQIATKSLWHTKTTVEDVSDLFDLVSPSRIGAVAPDDRDQSMLKALLSGTAPTQDRTRLPREFDGAPNGHLGSYQYLVDDFMRAIWSGTPPPIDAFRAADFTVPGIVAHQSAVRGGELQLIPDPVPRAGKQC
ncbi:Gfo/Idh/MocA family oxidoreductase [Saxibacter everestensis]|uniref:Gfo/Idh/MocA family oxidoreductase n=1 Tax=Saxibacter everestensis TaxID=2909229 RepID=A0ABY8QVA5_9MICO|nr:Gfo/Idh/MocA family oxidoreductase [Brevibacteriaceae bacterium ZFBP1038]